MAPPRPDPFVTTARDGTRLLIRAVGPEARQRFVEALGGLSDQSRYLRFARTLRSFTEAELRYLTEIDYRDHMAWAAVALDAPGAPSVAVGRYIRRMDEPRAAEVAVVVIDAYQRRGIAPVLLAALARTALDNGIERFEGDILGHNEAMLKLVRRLGVALSDRSDGVVHFEVALSGLIRAADAGIQSGALPASR